MTSAKSSFSQSSAEWHFHSSITCLFSTTNLYMLVALVAPAAIRVLTLSSSLLCCLLPIVVLGKSDAAGDSSWMHHHSTIHNNRTLTRASTRAILTLPILNHYQVHERLVRERKRYLLSQGPIQKGYPFGKLYQGFGTHYVDLWVGTPHPQRQTVIVDTGSGITSFPCEPCNDCGYGYHTDKDYRITESTSFSYQTCGHCSIGKCKNRSSPSSSSSSTCEISVSYSEGSKWKAYEARDVVYIGGSHDQEGQDRMRQLTHSQHGMDNSNQTNANVSGNLRLTHKETKIMEEDFRKKAKEVEEAYQKLQREKEREQRNHHVASAKDFSFELKFGCQYMITGLFKTQLADGIMGMENSDKAFWKQMYDAGVISSESFSLCFSQAEVASRNGTDAGVMTLGGSNTNLHQSPMVYAEHVDLDGWYGVYVNAMYLKYNDEEDVDNNGNQGNNNRHQKHDKKSKLVKIDLDIEKLNSEGILVDSGTTDSIFPSMVYEPFKKAFKELLGFDFMEKVPLKNDKNIHPPRDYPTIVIQLKAAHNENHPLLLDENGHPLQGLAQDLDLNAPNDVLVEISPEKYMTWSGSSRKYKNRFRMDDESGWGLIGANGMIGYDILFDVENDRMGFAKSDCVLKE
mmetsp:Transcript_2854/g.5342  ORF Transcript_2854/g.5342 Transcript_2854/m.5342 type:complete len:627 (+) Transcript_2854:292-2172(+)